MTGQFDLFGLYFPWLMMTALAAFIATLAIGKLLARRGLYQYIWHPPLFNTALFFIVLGISVSLFSYART